MTELLRRFRSRPGVTGLILLASMLAHLLGLISALYVIQVLNRYVSHGVDTTLATLTVGVLLAIAFEAGFRIVRLRLAATLSGRADLNIGIGAYGVLATARSAALERLPPGQAREAVLGLEQAEAAYSATGLVGWIDLPFVLLYGLVVYLISPVLALVLFCALLLSVGMGLAHQAAMRQVTRASVERRATAHGLVASLIGGAEAVRLFGAAPRLIAAWTGNLAQLQALRRQAAQRDGLLQSGAMALQAVTTVGIIAVGAVQAVRGDLSVGALIGANILATRALQPTNRLAGLLAALTRAGEARRRAQALAALPQEAEGGGALGRFAGRLELRDLAYTPPGAPAPLFEGVSLALEPGAVLVLTGRNGAGKSSMMRLIAGLVQPDRGQILADGTDIRQLAPSWWRRQLIYLPQEPTFVNGTIRENLSDANPDLPEAGWHRCLEQAGAAAHVLASPKGLDTPISGDGMTLARGIRRKLALARALATDGRLVLLDEPTEGLDQEGVRAMYDLLIELARQGRTICLSSHDPRIVRAAGLELDLDEKPRPQLRRAGQGGPAGQPASIEAGR
ncbi:peptidase domain-containing ABC transporter [Marinibaculum pumilum]|uniref:Peptidase domain-containing ABC transporter n=1 Tax=Marinibaculum pumilum TaxID=1766165 RepID=A0ABV7L6F3_9PROT